MTQHASGPLAGITVIDLSRILAGPYCTFLMAEMGARVIKVEPPKGGDDARAYGPFVNGKSTYFASVNRGQESIALDLKRDDDKRDIGAGLYTAVAVNAALVHRLKTGESTKIDIAMFDCQLALLENAIMRYTVEGEIPGPLGARHPTITPFQAFGTKDGAIIIAAGNDSLFVKMCEALGLAGLATSPDYKSNALRQKHHKPLEHSIESVLKGAPTNHWLEVLGKAGVPCGPINNVAQAIAHPQVAARNMLVEVPDGSGGTLKLAGNPIKMSAFA